MRLYRLINQTNLYLNFFIIIVIIFSFLQIFKGETTKSVVSSRVSIVGYLFFRG